ncbi:MAG: hypothetical protein MMC23_007877 [Stictis urceolatum]|nr:hypothetical protein [Stictis urceolata]
MHFNPAQLVLLASLVTSSPLSSLKLLGQRDALAEAQARVATQRSEPILLGARDELDEDSDLVWERDDQSVYEILEKRRGGGGGGGKGGGGSSGGKGGGSSSGSSGGSSGGRVSSSSTNAPKGFGGGSVYAGGSRSAYRAGGRSPGNINPIFFAGGAGLGLAAGAYAYGYYGYPYHTHYPYHNGTTNRNDSLPVDCFCQQYNPCGCDDQSNTTTINQMLKNNTVAKIQNVNGTKTVVINGTLPNGTEGDTSAASGFRLSLTQQSGYLGMAAVVAATIWGL